MGCVSAPLGVGQGVGPGTTQYSVASDVGGTGMLAMCTAPFPAQVRGREPPSSLALPPPWTLPSGWPTWFTLASCAGAPADKVGGTFT